MTLTITSRKIAIFYLLQKHKCFTSTLFCIVFHTFCTCSINCLYGRLEDCTKWSCSCSLQLLFFSLFRLEYLPNLASGEMLSHTGLQCETSPFRNKITYDGHRTSTSKQSRKIASSVHFISCTFLDNPSPHWGRDEGFPSSCPRGATFTSLVVDCNFWSLWWDSLVPPSMLCLDYINLFN